MLVIVCSYLLFHFFVIAPATTEIYTLSLHDALPICPSFPGFNVLAPMTATIPVLTQVGFADGRRYNFEYTTLGQVNKIRRQDRKSTRLNSSHSQISYAVFCLKKKTNAVTHVLALRVT